MGKKKKKKEISKYACGARLISPDTCIECGQRIRWTDPKNEGW